MKKHIFLSLILSAISLCGFAQNELIAFPGAEGFGRFTTGGRGGAVHYVTKLTDCPDNALEEGTLRWAIRHDNGGVPRTILFKVGGTIGLTSKLKFEYPDVSILGQSAPGGGICISGANIYVSKSNVIIRHIRFRAGDLADANYSALDIENVQNVIIDHCSMSWSMEENVTMYDNKNTTMQWCILSEPLYYSRHKKGQRGYGAQWGGENSSFHHNLFAHCVSRIPRINGVRTSGTSGHDLFVDSEIINNVMFNCGGGEALYGGELEAPNVAEAYCRTNLIGNYFKSGPVSKAKSGSNHLFATIYHTGNASGYGEFYAAGNKYEGNNYDPNNMAAANADNWTAITIKTKPAAATINDYKLNAPSASSNLTQTTADQAYIDVCKYAGAQSPRLDEIDTRILKEAAGEIAPQFKGSYMPAYIGVIDSQNDITLTNEDPTFPGWTDLRPKAEDIIPEDSDNDGMPDEWENENGLNPNDAEDRNGTNLSTDGYTNLEMYLNSLANNPVTSTTKTEIDNVKIYPNPVKDILHIESEEIISEVQIFDLSGKMIQKVNSNENRISIPTQHYIKGMYALKITTVNGKQSTLKVVK